MPNRKLCLTVTAMVFGGVWACAPPGRPSTALVAGMGGTPVDGGMAAAGGATNQGGSAGLGAGGAMNMNTGGAVNMNTGGAMNMNTGGAMNMNTGGAMKMNTGGAMNMNTGGAVNMNTGGAVNMNTGGAVNMNTGGTPPATTGLVGWWKMDEATGATSATDASGLSNPAQIVGGSAAASWVPGRNANAIHCTGLGGLVAENSTSLNEIASAGTFAAWVKPNAVSGDYQAILSRQTGTSGDEHYFLGFAYGQPGFLGDVGRVFATSPLTIGEWSHLAATYDGAMIRVYANGLQVAAGAGAGAFRTDTSKLTLCGNQNDASGTITENLNAVVDDLRIYKRALTAAEIADLAK